mmetsp:Transcript_18083/g.46283  ORF Transcript_18083/g.46283 Transcript_18083/m.46283 type:complete len:210 (+) Transcript_18083:797-1426(+)
MQAVEIHRRYIPLHLHAQGLGVEEGELILIPSRQNHHVRRSTVHHHSLELQVAVRAQRGPQRDVRAVPFPEDLRPALGEDVQRCGRAPELARDVHARGAPADHEDVGTSESCWLSVVPRVEQPPAGVPAEPLILPGNLRHVRLVEVPVRHSHTIEVLTVLLTTLLPRNLPPLGTTAHGCDRGFQLRVLLSPRKLRIGLEILAELRRTHV